MTLSSSNNINNVNSISKYKIVKSTYNVNLKSN